MREQHINNDDFLARLNAIIKSVGGNKESAEIIGKSVKSIERYKKGAEMPFDAVLKLVLASEFSIDWLVSGVQKKNTNIRQANHMDVQIVESAATALYDYLEKKDHVLEPKDFGKTVALICDLSKDPKDINVDLIDRLMRFKGDI